jgi:YebC/PmpR family DNA-binding regulatory protein
VRALTDNRNRAVADIRRAFSRHGGNLGENGCVAWMFEKKGYLVVEKSVIDEDTLMETALEAGAEDVREDGDNFEVVTAPEDFEAVKEAIDAAEVATLSAEVTMLPQNMAELAGKDAEKMIKLMDALDDCDDVQKVYTNADIPDEVVAALG